MIISKSSKSVVNQGRMNSKSVCFQAIHGLVHFLPCCPPVLLIGNYSITQPWAFFQIVSLSTLDLLLFSPSSFFCDSPSPLFCFLRKNLFPKLRKNALKAKKNSLSQRIIFTNEKFYSNKFSSCRKFISPLRLPNGYYFRFSVFRLISKESAGYVDTT